jgi:glycosyltransferase involved in cell wall biosynthesis
VEINLFTLGDSRDINTWSGFPYFVSNALERNGVTLNRIDVFPDRWIQEFYNAFFGYWARFSRLFFRRNASRNFYFSRMMLTLVTHKVKVGCARFPNADYHLFMGPDVPIYKFSSTPTLLYLDQSFAQAFDRQHKSVLTRMEKFYLDMQNENLRRARWVFATNPGAIEFLRIHTGLQNLFLRPLTGINLEVNNVDIKKIIERKRCTRDLLFIGRNVSGRGADILLAAFRLLNDRCKEAYRLHLVGMTREELGAREDEQIVCYGFLDKSKPANLATYLDLLSSARVFVMPYRGSLLAFAMLEAMAMGTPVIVSNVTGITQFVQNMENGLVLDETAPDAFADAIERLTQDHQLWERLAQNAYTSMKKYSWDQVARDILGVLNFQHTE